MKIFLEEILEYYDGILLFVGKDLFGSKYLCSLYYDDTADEEFYLAIRVSDKRLAELVNHKKDLREALLNPEEKGEYFQLDWSDSEYYSATRFEDGFTPANPMLPEEQYLIERSNWNGFHPSRIL